MIITMERAFSGRCHHDEVISKAIENLAIEVGWRPFSMVDNLCKESESYRSIVLPLRWDFVQMRWSATNDGSSCCRMWGKPWSGGSVCSSLFILRNWRSIFHSIHLINGFKFEAISVLTSFLSPEWWEARGASNSNFLRYVWHDSEVFSSTITSLPMSDALVV